MIFLVDCHELLHKMGIVERFSVEFVTYQFQGNAKMWWRSYVECQPAQTPPMTWASFSSLFMEKYIPRILRDRKRDEFLSLEHGSMSVTAYEAKFRALSQYATLLQSTRADSPFCEAIEVRFADSSLTGSYCSKILSGGGRFCDRSGGSEARRLHHGIDT